LWPFIVLGAINLMLTVSVRLPFGLLLILAFVAVGVVRVPYLRGRYVASAAPAPQPDGALSRLPAPPWVIAANRRYEALPESRQTFLLACILVVAGAVNMLLTIGYGFPFGLLFLLALLILVAVRAPYANGWFGQAAPDPTEPAIPFAEHDLGRSESALPKAAPPADPIAAEDGPTNALDSSSPA
jgi:hypothetical protein